MRCRCDARGVIFWIGLHVTALFLFGKLLQHAPRKHHGPCSASLLIV
jgi:hypothetical protein